MSSRSTRLQSKSFNMLGQINYLEPLSKNRFCWTQTVLRLLAKSSWITHLLIEGSTGFACFFVSSFLIIFIVFLHYNFCHAKMTLNIFSVTIFLKSLKNMLCFKKRHYHWSCQDYLFLWWPPLTLTGLPRHYRSLDGRQPAAGPGHRGVRGQGVVQVPVILLLPQHKLQARISQVRLCWTVAKVSKTEVCDNYFHN